MENKSKFHGKVGELFLHVLVASLVVSVTCGIALPWAICYLGAYIAKNIELNGRKLKFTGKAGSLFGNYIKWWLLSIVTCGIYSLWVPTKVVAWAVKNVHFADSDESVAVSEFKGSGLGVWGMMFLYNIICGATLYIATPWAMVMLVNYILENSVVDGCLIEFSGKGGAFFGTWLLGLVLGVITCGIYLIWFQVKLISWFVERTSYKEA